MLAFLLLAFAAPSAEAVDAIAKGFDHFYNIEYDQALAIFTQLAQANPNDPDSHTHIAQTLLYRDMYRAGALESELVTGNNPFVQRQKVKLSDDDTARFDQAIRKAMELSQAKLGENPNDARALYSLGVAYGLRANYNFLVRKAWTDALKDATQARKNHNRVTEIDPKIVDAKLVQGAHDYVVGSLPFTYKMLGFLVGYRGDKDEGVRALKRVATEGANNRVDAQILLAAIYRRERRPEDAIPLLDEMIKKFPRNHLLRLELVQMYADKGDKNAALEVLRKLEELKRGGQYPSMPIEKVYYSRGNLLFWYHDYDQALANLARVTPRAKEIDTNTGMNAWLRTGQSYDVKGERKKATDAYWMAINSAPDSDAAKEAKKYVASPYKRKKDS